ncbi:molybdopterin synthase sulfur carrier subunit [Thermodesulfovibrio aggregans]|uniref:Molybdopterin synthase sulfur carrier subunit n=1 Tax=Thermodesulfovibrio aggregans TaxID=86166 RepID=A0A0U9HUR9_9BACT|nr:MoaD/ThiS family protein [Thermodesulfovibrio aggregans]GAQ94609.1 molybdopterin synthase sulfur carrier subunit [Thermodesulfovibrio aggregans]
MKVTVKLFGGIKSDREFPKNEGGDIIFESSEPVTVSQLIEFLSLNKKPFIVVLNGVILNDLSIKIKDGDEISLFPPIAGGDEV